MQAPPTWSTDRWRQGRDAPPRPRWLLAGLCAAFLLLPACAPLSRQDEAPPGVAAPASPMPRPQTSPEPPAQPAPTTRDAPPSPQAPHDVPVPDGSWREPGWELVWADEFDGPACPDPANWGYETGFVRNEELQWYRPENAFCKDGVLVLEARRESFENPAYVPSSRDWRTSRKAAAYTSASIETKDRHEWQYGRIDVRARFDVGAGAWPAIWTLGTQGRWPGRGEIDIMESFGGRITAYLHWHGGKKRANVMSVRRSDLLWPREYHVWGMHWSSERIDILFDGRPVASFDIRDVTNPDGTNPFRQPHYLKLNLAVSPIAGNPARGHFPARLEVDYVRVYQRRNAAPPTQ